MSTKIALNDAATSQLAKLDIYTKKEDKDQDELIRRIIDSDKVAEINLRASLGKSIEDIIVAIDSQLLATGQQELVAFFSTFQKVPYSIISSFGKSFAFYDRTPAIDAIVKNTLNHHKAPSGDRNDHPFIVASGAPGIGKSRLLQEYGDIVHQRLQELDRRKFLHTTLALRVLSHYFSVSWSAIEDKWRPEWKLTLRAALITIRMHYSLTHFIADNDTLAIYLGLDEFQHLLRDHTEERRKREWLKRVVLKIGSRLCEKSEGVFLVAVLAGTVYTPLSAIFAKSGHKHIPVPLPLLSIDSSLKIVSSVQSNMHLDQHQLKLALLQIGGWPRPLEYFLEILSKHCSEDTIVNFASILGLTAQSLFARYGPQNNNVVQQLVARCITTVPVEPADWSTICPVRGSTNTYADYESGGYITKRLKMDPLNPDVVVSYFVEIPILFVTWSTLLTSLASMESLNRLLLLLQQDSTWQRWEIFLASYSLLRSDMFMFLGWTEVTLKEFFGEPRVPSDNNRLQWQIDLLPDYFQEQGCLDWKTTPLVKSNMFINAPASPWGDWFSYHGMHSSKSKIFIVGQGKHTAKRNQGALPTGIIDLEYQKVRDNSKSLNTYPQKGAHTFMFFATNKTVPST
eukprot:gene16798-19978_t